MKAKVRERDIAMSACMLCNDGIVVTGKHLAADHIPSGHVVSRTAAVVPQCLRVPHFIGDHFHWAAGLSAAGPM